MHVFFRQISTSRYNRMRCAMDEARRYLLFGYRYPSASGKYSVMYLNEYCVYICMCKHIPVDEARRYLLFGYRYPSVDGKNKYVLYIHLYIQCKYVCIQYKLMYICIYIRDSLFVQ
jgi:hypothetical protein